jgi:vitamin B12 transporter
VTRPRRLLAATRWVGLCAALAAPLPAAAADPGTPPAQGEPVPVYDVYVTSRQDLVSEVTTTRVVTREDMHWESARTLDEAVIHEPSLVVRTGGEGSPRIDIRGLRTRQILTLVDGVPFYSSEDGAFDPSLIPTQIMQSVDITYSNSSVLYGDGPIAGILQIRTRPGDEGLHPEARGDFRSGNQYLGEGSVSGGHGPVEGFVAGRYFSSDGWYLPDSFDPTDLENGGLRDNSDRDQWNFFGKAGYVFEGRGRVDALVDYRHAEYGVPSRTEQQNDYVGRARFERVDHVDGATAQLSGQLDASEKVALRSWGFFNRQEEQRSGYDDPNLDSMLERNSFELTGTTLVGGGALHGRVDLGTLGTVRLAVNGRYEQFETNGRIRDVNQGGGSFAFRSVDEQNSYGVWSLAGEYELKPSEQIGLVLGYGHAFIVGDQSVSDDANLVLVGGYWNLPTKTRLRASAAHKVRFPSLRQFYALDGGNTSLEAERCWCFEVGAAQPLPWLHATLGVTGFWLELRDFIERDDTTDLFENRQKLESRGVEVEVVSHPWKPVVIRTAYTFLDARDVSNGSPYDRLDNRPRHKVDAELRLTAPTGTTFRAAMTWLGDSLIYTRNDPIRSAHLDDFALVDLRLGQALLEDRLRLYFGVDNVTDQESEVNVFFPQPGRTYYGGIELRY